MDQLKGKISIYKYPDNIPKTKIRSNSSFFDGPITYGFEDDCLIFKRVGLDRVPNTVNPYKEKTGRAYTFDIRISHEGFDCITETNYEFDEDSTEDEVIICLK